MHLYDIPGTLYNTRMSLDCLCTLYTHCVCTFLSLVIDILGPSVYVPDDFMYMVHMYYMSA